MQRAGAVDKPISPPANAPEAPGREEAPARWPAFLSDLLPGLFRFGFDATVLPILVLAAAGYFGAFAWLPDMTNFFRPHIAALAAGLLLLGLLARSGPRLAAGAGIFLAAALPIVLPSLPHAAAAPEADLRLLSTNVQGGENGDVEAYRRLLEAVDPDVIVAQEVAPDWQRVFRSLPGYPYFSVAETMGGASTVFIASRYPVRVTRLKGEGQHPFAFGAYPLRAELDLPGASAPIILYGIHPPTPRSAEGWAERNAYLAEVARRVAEERAAGRDVIVAGDWNTPVWSPFFRATLREAGLGSSEGVWPAPTRIFREFGVPERLGSPIDHVAVTPRIGVAGLSIGAGFGADHLPVIVDLKAP